MRQARPAADVERRRLLWLGVQLAVAVATWIGLLWAVPFALWLLWGPR